VEGMRNESIVASALVYYSQDNVSDGQVAFRQAVSTPVHGQGDDRGLWEVYGLQYGDALVQPLGQVDTFEGQSLAFPNVYQHRVSPFSLIDPTRPGHRSFLAFFLVDPTQRVLSTARVPPQQAEWMWEGLMDAMADSVPVRVLQKLIVEYVGWPMSAEEARCHRRALLEERKGMIRDNTEGVFEQRLKGDY
jgi:hypothetical protein